MPAPGSEAVEVSPLAPGEARFGEALHDDVFDVVVGAELAFLGPVAGGFGLPTGVDA